MPSKFRGKTSRIPYPTELSISVWEGKKDSFRCARSHKSYFSCTLQKTTGQGTPLKWGHQLRKKKTGRRKQNPAKEKNKGHSRITEEKCQDEICATVQMRTGGLQKRDQGEKIIIMELTDYLTV